MRWLQFGFFERYQTRYFNPWCPKQRKLPNECRSCYQTEALRWLTKQNSKDLRQNQADNKKLRSENRPELGKSIIIFKARRWGGTRGEARVISGRPLGCCVVRPNARSVESLECDAQNSSYNMRWTRRVRTCLKRRWTRRLCGRLTSVPRW